MVSTKARASIRQNLPKKVEKWGFKVCARFGDSDVYLGVIHKVCTLGGEKGELVQLKAYGSYGGRGNVKLQAYVRQKFFFCWFFY